MLENWNWVIGFELKWANYTSLLIWLDIFENCFEKLNSTTLSKVYGNSTEAREPNWSAFERLINTNMPVSYIWIFSFLRPITALTLNNAKILE